MVSLAAVGGSLQAAGGGTSARARTIAGGANVFVAPPASAALATHGSDTDTTNCKRFASPVAAPPGGPGFGCADFQQAYVLAQPGDTVWLNWNGAWPLSQTLGPAGAKTGSAACDYPRDTSGCVVFRNGPGLTPSLQAAATSCNYGPCGSALRICAPLVELDGLTFNRVDATDQYGPITDSTWDVGKGDNSCQPSGRPPHDVFVHDVVSNGPIGIVGGANHVYVLGGSVGNMLNSLPQFGGVATVNGVITTPVSYSTIDGVTFTNIVGQGIPQHHMDCVHMDGGGDHDAIVNSRIVNSNCGYQSIRMESELYPSPAWTNITIENDVFDVPGHALGVDCHANNCTMSNIVVRFNTFSGSGFAPSNDCALNSGNICTVKNNSVYGNLFVGVTPCQSSAAVYGAGWIEYRNVTTQSWPTGSTICGAGDGSAFDATVNLANQAGEDYHLTGPQTAVDFVPTSVAGGYPAVDADGDLRPLGAALDAGFDEEPQPDTTPPVVTCPRDLTAEATGPDGARVTFECSAVDPDDAAGPVSCEPSSGSLFAIGATPVVCRSTDTHGNTGTASLRVSVLDTTPPSAPAAVTIADGTQQTQLTVSWTSSRDAVGVTGYSILLDGVQAATVPATSTSAAVTGLTWGSHQVAVRAFDAASNRSAPSVLTATSAWR